MGRALAAGDVQPLRNVIDELVGEPALAATEQITRAREAVVELEKPELDKLMAELFERPTIAAAEDEGDAAARFYSPTEESP